MKIENFKNVTFITFEDSGLNSSNFQVNTNESYFYLADGYRSLWRLSKKINVSFKELCSKLLEDGQVAVKYLDNGLPYGRGFLEIQVSRYPFHSGLRVLVTDGYKYTSDVIKEIKNFKNNARDDQTA
jgi:hypothetical protein